MTAQPPVNSDTTPEATSGVREVRFQHTHNFGPLLAELGVSLIVSTYQAGKLVVVGVREGALNLSYHSFPRPMGVALQSACIAVGTRQEVWFLRAAADLGPHIEPAGTFDACFLARACHFTGDIQIHEMAWAGNELWIANTLFCCLCTLGSDYSFVPRWCPPFITALAAEDRCHLNGLALAEGQPRYVTVLAATDTPQGWRPHKTTGGCLIEVPSGRVVARGFAMPHSPRVYRGRVWLLDSGAGRLVTVDPADGRVETVAQVPGYARGLSFVGTFAFVGVSRIRETAVFGGLAVAQRHEHLRCGVGAIDLASGRNVAYLEFQSGVEEIFAVEALPGARLPALSGPSAGLDDGPSIWRVPEFRPAGGGGAIRSP
jgi:uncharacterized protein (TIGR03032 family)